MRRPEAIDQIIPSIVEHDAVSNHAFEAQRLLRAMGFSSEIYAANIGPGTEGRVVPLAAIPRRPDGGQWVLYQCSIGSPAAEVFASHPGTKLLDYHNITPAALVERWIPPLGDEARLGRRQLAELAPIVAASFADSAFNAAELAGVGFSEAGVVPVLVESANLEAAADPLELARLAGAKRAGGADWLFVGQVAPHKAQHDLIGAFACYRRLFDPAARLHVVGRPMGSAYLDALRRFVASLGLSAAVEFTGSVPVGTLVAHYESADVFVCCSDHEGFCVPVVESMARGLPVVAYGAAAIPETVGGAGIVLDRKDPTNVAAAVHEVLASTAVRAAAIEAGRAQAARYTLEGAREAFRREIEGALRA